MANDGIQAHNVSVGQDQLEHGPGQLAGAGSVLGDSTEAFLRAWATASLGATALRPCWVMES